MRDATMQDPTAVENDPEPDDLRDWIDRSSYDALLQKHRFGPRDDPIFQGEIGRYFRTTMELKRREIGPEEYMAASTRVGWLGVAS